MRNQPFFIDTFRSLLDQYNREEISLSKLVEDLNTTAHSWATDTEKKATWVVQDIDLITDYADFDAKAKIKMIEDRIQKFWKDTPPPSTPQPVTGEAGELAKEIWTRYVVNAPGPKDKPIIDSNMVIAAMEEYRAASRQSDPVELDLVKGVVDRLFSLMPYHINPYNLGEQGEIGSLINTLNQIFNNSKSPNPNHSILSLKQ